MNHSGRRAQFFMDGCDGVFVRPYNRDDGDNLMQSEKGRTS